MDPKNLRYQAGCTSGLTPRWHHLLRWGSPKFAVEQLTDVVYIELPDVGDNVFAGESFGEIESVKAVNDLYSPLSGEVAEVNKELENDPTLVARPYGKGWMIKIKMPGPAASTS